MSDTRVGSDSRSDKKSKPQFCSNASQKQTKPRPLPADPHEAADLITSQAVARKNHGITVFRTFPSEYAEKVIEIISQTHACLMPQVDENSGDDDFVSVRVTY